jgi:hypothetical protein
LVEPKRDSRRYAGDPKVASLFFARYGEGGRDLRAGDTPIIGLNFGQKRLLI